MEKVMPAKALSVAKMWLLLSLVGFLWKGDDCSIAEVKQ
jgi:hypothetical protein